MTVTDERLRVGLVGCGWHGAALAQAIVRSEHMRLCACADPDLVAANAAAAAAREASTHVSVEALLAEAEVDAVVVATPHHLLAPVTLAALRAGKPVLAEKPIALSAAEADEVAAAAARAGVCSMAGYSFRFGMGRHLQELVVAGATGEILGLSGAIGCGPLDEGWIAYPETGGGALLYLGCHLVDLALWLLDDAPTAVWAQVQRRADTGADETTALQIRFARGTLAQFLVTQAATSFFYELGLHGRAGSVALHGNSFLQFELGVHSTALPAYSQPTTIRPAVHGDHITTMLLPELEEFASAVREHRPPAVTVADGRRVLQILDAAAESARTGRPIELPR